MRCGGDGIVPGADAHRVPEREQHERLAEFVSGLRLVHAGDGGEGGARRLREWESDQCAGWDLQGSRRLQSGATSLGEALGVWHSDEAPVVPPIRLDSISLSQNSVT